MAIAYLSVGSNKGDKLKNIKELLKLIRKEDFVKIVSLSSLYETEPVGYKDQDNFYNFCIKIKSRLKPKKLIEWIKSMEKKLGRETGIKWGPRTIDVDILYYDDMIINEHGLNIPHPEIQNRKFVLIPLLEIEPKLVSPDSGKKVKSLLDEIKSNSYIKKLNIRL